MHKHPRNAVFSERLFEYRSVEKAKLVLSLSITLSVMIVEFIGGLLTHSIALISDAGHMFTHAFAVGISLVAILIARKPLCHHRTFGLYRAEILAAFVNGLFLFIVAGVIVYEAIIRMRHPEHILGYEMLIIACLGLVTNMASILILKGSQRKNLNVRSVFSHMIADAASSIGIIIGAVVILYTGWSVLDPIVSLVISTLIMYWAFGILRESAIILLEMAPTGLNTDIISEDLKTTFPEIVALDAVHLWSITADMLVFSAHIAVAEKFSLRGKQDVFIQKIHRHLSKKYHIIESTIQITSFPQMEICNDKGKDRISSS